MRSQGKVLVTDAPFGNNHTTDIPLEQFYRQYYVRSQGKVLVTDAPFGNNHTTDIPLEQFYKAILCEISR